MLSQIITLEQIRDLNPCYDESELIESAHGRTECTLRELLSLEHIPPADRLWVVLHEEFIPAAILHEFACRCAERALALVDKPDPRSVAAIGAKRAWLRGEIADGALAKAMATAISAAWDDARATERVAERAAAWDDARATERVAERAAALAAARAAERAAALAAARAAALAAAWTSTRLEQIKLLIELLEVTDNA